MTNSSIDKSFSVFRALESANIEVNEASFALLGVLLALLVVYIRKHSNKISSNHFPTGPSYGFPILGYLPFLGKNAAVAFTNLAKRYGNIYSVKLGTRRWIVLNDYESIREALVKQKHRFSGRNLDVFVVKALSNMGKHGIVGIDYGQQWRVQRTFGVHVLKRLGVGKGIMRERIMSEAGYLVDSLKSTEGKAVVAKEYFMKAASSVICSVILGERFEYDNERINRMITCIARVFKDKLDTILTGLVVFVPFLEHVPPFKGSCERVLADLNGIHDVFQEIIEERKQSHSDHEERDFIDAFFTEMKKQDVDSSFTEKQLLSYLKDMYIAGTETSASVVGWCVLGFLHYPEYQGRIRKEIDSVVGNRQVSMEDNKQLPFTCAYIQEVMRHRLVAPIGIPRKTVEDVKILGYTIPKDTSVITNVWGIHYDPKNFEDPETFLPDRFISADGKFISSRKVIPFSIGERNCLGEQLARMEVFLYVASLVQKFYIKKDPMNELPSFHDGVFSTVYPPPLFKASFISR